jgi:hypothetical protein
MTPPFQVVSGNCLVYSFGIGNDWSFDDGISKFGCEVHSFDPSIGLADHFRKPNIHFHNLGLWGSDIINAKKWNLEKLSTIRKRLGHEKRPIDVLKIDAEGAEWPFFRNMIEEEPDQLDSVRQLILEIHTPRVPPQRMSVDDMIEIIYYARRLSDLGFVVWRNRHSGSCCGAFAPLMPPGVVEKCCHEIHYVNRRYRATDQ